MENVRSLALMKRPVNVEANLSAKPYGRIVMDNKVQPFGSSARMEGMRKSNGR